MTDQEWRDNLKIGDDVIIASVFNANGAYRKVGRTTPTQIVVNWLGKEIKYWRKTGRIVGGKSGWLVQPEVTK